MLAGAALAVFLTASPLRTPVASAWETHGPAYPRIDVLAIPANEENTVYAGSRDPVSGRSGLFRSEDGARTWTLLAEAPFQATIRKLAIDPTGSSRMLALTASSPTHGQLYRTDDGGATWRLKSSPVVFSEDNVFFDPVQPDTAFFVSGGLRRSEGDGPWADVAVRPPAASAWASPDGELYWAVHVRGPGWFPSWNDEIRVSKDGGRHVDVSSPAPCLSIETVAFALSDTNVAYATGPQCQPLLTSRDGGASWTAVESNSLLQHLQSVSEARVAQIAVDPSDAAVVYLVATSAEGPDGGVLLQSVDAGERWRVLAVPETPSGPIAISPSSRFLYVGTIGGVFRLPLPRTRLLPPRD